MAKDYKLYAMVYGYYDDNVKSVNSSYYTENMVKAQDLFENDLRNRGMVPLVIMSEAQVRKRVFECSNAKH